MLLNCSKGWKMRMGKLTKYRTFSLISTLPVSSSSSTPWHTPLALCKPVSENGATNSAAVSQQGVWNVSYKSEIPTFSFSAGVTWFVADFIFSKRALCPAHSALSSWISDIISSVVSELLSSFSSENKRFYTHAHTYSLQVCANEQDFAAKHFFFFLTTQTCPDELFRPTCIQLSAALGEGLHLRTKLWDLTVHGLQLWVLHIFKLSLNENLEAATCTSHTRLMSNVYLQGANNIWKKDCTWSAK